MRKTIFVLAVAALFVCYAPAFAFQATFFGEDSGGKVRTNSDAARADFFSYLIGVGTEDFESFSYGTSAPLTVDFGSAGTATLTGMGSIKSGDSVGRWAISGTQYWEAPGSSSSLFSIVFSDPIAAFGFYGTDIGDFNGQVTVTTMNGENTTYTIPHSMGQANYANTCLYWGVIDTENLFTSITFANTGSGSDWFGFDDFSIGSLEQVDPTPHVPEPATLLLLGMGFLGLGVLRRR